VLRCIVNEDPLSHGRTSLKALAESHVSGWSITRASVRDEQLAMDEMQNRVTNCAYWEGEQLLTGSPFDYRLLHYDGSPTIFPAWAGKIV